MKDMSVDKIDEIVEERSDFMRSGLEKLQNFHQEMIDLEWTLQDIEKIGGEKVAKQAYRLYKHIHGFEPSITMIGQIKSGKTSLVNTMIGRPDLLPADVNPWTSVVTSLHLNAPRAEGAPKVSFQLFDKDEWDHLVESGGRIGELSSRAGADEELEKVREQIAQMREKTRDRLGRKFELLLGQQHNYETLTEDLVQRYVCMGDDFDDLSKNEQQGRFADITKSADIYLDAPNVPVPLCIRDTPGVNDTFMMREQITIKSLRDSRICVVVLSAHQALSSTDMGLIRLISNVKAREVVIFVNRIDELADPVRQIPEIRESIVQTLKTHDGPKDAEIIFGSAHWAKMALKQDLGDVSPDEINALMSINPAIEGGARNNSDHVAKIWHISGVPHLFDALSDRIVEGIGADVLASTRKRALNHVNGLRRSNSVVSMKLDGDKIDVMEQDALLRKIDEVSETAINSLNADLDAVFDKFSGRIDQSHKRFLDRALESLLQHLEENGEDRVWQYSPDGLRMLLRTSYQVMRRNVSTTCDQIFSRSATDMSGLYEKMFDVVVENFEISAPNAPEIPSPVSLGQTIALDLQSSWWKGWWKRRKGYRAYADGFYDMIEAETAPIVEDLKTRQSAEIRKMAEAELREFLAEQRNILKDISDKANVNSDDLNSLFGISAQEERDELFEIIVDDLDVESVTDQAGTANE